MVSNHHPVSVPLAKRGMGQVLLLLAIAGHLIHVFAIPLPLQPAPPSTSSRLHRLPVAHDVSGRANTGSAAFRWILVLSNAAARAVSCYRLQPPHVLQHMSTWLRAKWTVVVRQQSTADNGSLSPGVIALIAVASALFLLGPVFFCFFCGCCSCSKVKERREARREANEERSQDSDEKSTTSRKSKLDCRLSEVGPVRPDLAGGHAWTAPQDEVAMFRNPPAQPGAEGDA